MTYNYLFIIIFFLSYLIGSVPFGLILTNLYGNRDLTTYGSGNIGATNVLRTGNKKLALLTLILDFSKSFLPLFIFFKFIKDFLYLRPLDHLNLDEDALTLLFGYFFILGHCYPIWLKFKGGKGVATSLGVIMALNPFIGILLFAIWVTIFFIFKISSLSALISSICFPILIYFYYHKLDLTLLSMFTTFFIFFTHRTNIKRILNKEEKKI